MRYTIDFDPSFDKTLSDLVKNTGASTKAEVIRRAVASYSYLKKQQAENEDVKVAIVDKNNNITKEIVLP
jgi:aspartate 1-decarboxylase